MITFEKGASYNFLIERIALTKNNYYYVIQVENKECWIKMYPFEIYQNTPKKIIRCEYRGRDSFGSHIFLEDRLSILYELYEEKQEYEFCYVKDGIDIEGKSFSTLKDKHGLNHRLYESLSEEQKNNEEPIRCTINSIDKTTKMLVLHIVRDTNNNEQSIDTLNTNSPWINAESIFKAIGKEELLNDYFYNLNSYSQCPQQKNVIKLYHEKNKKWITHYLSFLDKKYKTILIQNEDLDKLTEFADLMIGLINWAKSFRITKLNKLPKLNKYNGLKKAVEILQENSLQSYKESFSLMENLNSEISTILSLLEIDKDLFGHNFPFYKETWKILYDNIINMEVSDNFSESKKEKILKAFQGIMSNRFYAERKRITNNILQNQNPSAEATTNSLASQLCTLLKYPDRIDSQTIYSYIDMRPHILSAMVCIIYGTKQLYNIENYNELLININNLLYLSTNYKEKESYKQDTEKMEEDTVQPQTEQQTFKQSEKQPNEASFFFNLYTDNTYTVTENQIVEDNIIQSVTINPNKDKFILQCYEHGSINKIPIRVLQEKRRARRYLNGCYSQDCLKEIYVINEETYIAIVSSYNRDTFIKLYSTQYISEHLSLGLKGNQVVGTNVDSTEYFLIFPEYINQLPPRLIYYSASPFGKNVKNPYYENDILILKDLGILKL